MKFGGSKRIGLAVAVGVLFLAVLSCSEAQQAPYKTAVAAAAQTALEEGERAARTQAAHLIETAQAAAQTQALSIFETLIAGPGNSGSMPQFRQPVSGEGLSLSTGSGMHIEVDMFAVDYAMAVEGAEIFPTLPGEVVYSGCRWVDYGCCVAMRHTAPGAEAYFYSIYAHMQEGSLAAEGAVLDGSVALGRMGMTGDGSNGVIHLHFAVRVSNEMQDGLNALYGESGQTAFDFRPFLAP